MHSNPANSALFAPSANFIINSLISFLDNSFGVDDLPSKGIEDGAITSQPPFFLSTE